MAKKAEKKEEKGLFGKVIDAVTSRDEKAAAEAATEEADTAKARAAREDAKRQLAEARAEQVKRQADASEAAKEEAEKRVADLEAKLAKAEAKTRQEEARTKLEAYQAKKEEEAAPPTYKVKGGDSLSKIAKEQLGDAGRWNEIFEMNKDQISDPNLIRVGQELKLPKA